MPNLPVMMGIMDPLYNLFGWVLRNMYAWLENYGLVIIVFTILLNVILIPFGVKSQKSLLKQQGLQDEINEIKRLYPDDPQMQQQLQAELFKQNGVSLAGGCLPSFLRLIFILPVFRIFQQPLHYIGGVSLENIAKIGEYLTNNNLVGETAAKMMQRSDIPILSVLQNNAGALGDVVDKGYLKLNQLIDLDFFGINLGMTPSWKPAEVFGDDWRVYLPLLILPLLTIIAMVVQMALTRKTSQVKVVDKAEIERAKQNPARAAQSPQDKSNTGMMKGMNFFMIAIMIWTMFTLPSAMGVYWFVNSVMGIAQSLFIYYFYTKPFRLALGQNNQSYNKRRSVR
ncbi:MAG: YidC/Oxa1 family membrane protein insertase [Clostridiaceae bacterium]|nr:YidC/Oxa1 family membrane protein insertase [Clostridiaceae bacterium]